MAKQKRSHAGRGRGGSGKGHGLAWFLAGGLTGGLATWVLLGHDPAAEQVRATVERTVGHPIGVDSTAPPAAPKFEFYTLLPEMEVVVPEEDLAAPAPTPAQGSAATETETALPTRAAIEAATTATTATTGDTDPALKSSGHYIVQVASFRSIKEADGLKAQLTLLGFQPVVQTVAINSDEKWHRVRIGPYSDRDSLEAARVRLRADGHNNPLVVWVKKG